VRAAAVARVGDAAGKGGLWRSWEPRVSLRAPQRGRPPRFPTHFLGKAVGSVYLSSCAGALFLWKLNWTLARALYVANILLMLDLQTWNRV
jgi:hypothetical protein